jgi:hypothetical protein
VTLHPDWTTLGLWSAVIASGIYHGVSPGMGWPLAVSAGLMGNGRRDLLKSLGPLAIGHFVAMSGFLLPFAIVSSLVFWEWQIRFGAGLLLVLAGTYLFIKRRHPRFIARIPPTRLMFWSFVVALAHGAGLMLLPIYLGLCRAEDIDAGHQASAVLMQNNLATAIAVASAHTVAMIASGGLIAFAVYQWLGPRFISRSWFNLETVWAGSLIVVGLISIAVLL